MITRLRYPVYDILSIYANILLGGVDCRKIRGVRFVSVGLVADGEFAFGTGTGLAFLVKLLDVAMIICITTYEPTKINMGNFARLESNWLIVMDDSCADSDVPGDWVYVRQPINANNTYNTFTAKNDAVFI